MLVPEYLLSHHHGRHFIIRTKEPIIIAEIEIADDTDVKIVDHVVYDLVSLETVEHFLEIMKDHYFRLCEEC